MTVLGTSTAVRLALFLKKFLMYHVVMTVNFLMKKVLEKLKLSVKIPARGGKISLFKLKGNKMPGFIAASYSLAVSESNFSSTSIQDVQNSHLQAGQLVQGGDGRAADHKLLFVRGVYQYKQRCTEGLLYPLSFVTAACSIFLNLPAAHVKANRILLS